MDSTDPTLPTWVRKRDGTTESFDPEKIHRALFTATESAGHADPLLARELTDGVLHFLAAEADHAAVASKTIADTLIKVVRELGHAWVAKALIEPTESQRHGGDEPMRFLLDRPDAVYGPSRDAIQRWMAEGKSPFALGRRIAAAGLEAFSLDNVFSPNLKAAHQEGLLVLGGLSTPRELTSAAIRFPAPEPGGARGGAPFEAIERARQFVGRVIALDSPEYELAHRGLRVGELPAFLREMEFAARTLALQVEINLGGETPPAWAEEISSGPLFDAVGPSESHERVGGHFGALAEHLMSSPSRSALRLNWHLTERDFANDTARARLLRLVRSALAGTPIAFVCDRPRQSIALADGLCRECPAILQWVGLNLPALLDRFPESDPRTYGMKLMSLVRLAAGAGAQKRDFIRRFGMAERPPFLLDQARLGLYLMGLPAITEAFFGEALSTSDEGQAFAEALLRDLSEMVGRESAVMPIRCVLEEMPQCGGGFLSSGTERPGAGRDWRGQFGLAGRLHAAIGRGSLCLPVHEDLAPEPLRLLELLQFAWKQTAVHRIRFDRVRARQTQLTASWQEAV